MYAVRLKEISDVLGLVISAPASAGRKRAASELLRRASATIREAGADCAEEGFEDQLARVVTLFGEAVRAGVAVEDTPEAKTFLEAAGWTEPGPAGPDQERADPGPGTAGPLPGRAGPGVVAREETPEGERLVRARMALGMKQKDLAAEIGISQGYLCRIEKGRCPGPGGELGQRISRFLSSAGHASEPERASSAPDLPLRAGQGQEESERRGGAGGPGPEEKTSGKLLLVRLLDICSRLPDGQLEELIRAAKSMESAGPQGRRSEVYYRRSPAGRKRRPEEPAGGTS